MATMKLFRCERPSCLTKDRGQFWSCQPICPQCKLEANDPKFGSKIIRLQIVHFDPPTDFPGVGQNYRACDHAIGVHAATGPGGVPNPYHGATGDPRFVNCPKCLATDDCKTAMIGVGDEDGPANAALQRIETLPRA